VAGANDPAPAGLFSSKSTTAACSADTLVVGRGVSLGDQNAQSISTSF
jgi:hypothetical protein